MLGIAILVIWNFGFFMCMFKAATASPFDENARKWFLGVMLHMAAVLPVGLIVGFM